MWIVFCKESLKNGKQIFVQNEEASKYEGIVVTRMRMIAKLSNFT